MTDGGTGSKPASGAALPKGSGVAFTLTGKAVFAVGIRNLAAGIRALAAEVKVVVVTVVGDRVAVCGLGAGASKMRSGRLGLWSCRCHRR